MRVSAKMARGEAAEPGESNASDDTPSLTGGLLLCVCRLRPYPPANSPRSRVGVAGAGGTDVGLTPAAQQSRDEAEREADA